MIDVVCCGGIDRTSKAFLSATGYLATCSDFTPQIDGLWCIIHKCTQSTLWQSHGSSHEATENDEHTSGPWLPRPCKAITV